MGRRWTGWQADLRVVDSGWLEVAWSEDQQAHYVEDHRHGWEIHLGHLRQYLADRTYRAREVLNDACVCPRGRV